MSNNNIEFRKILSFDEAFMKIDPIKAIEARKRTFKNLVNLHRIVEKK